MSSGMPYLSVPTYMKDTYVFLFPVKYYKFTLFNKIPLLTPEEKKMIELVNEINEQKKNMGKYESVIPRSIKNEEITHKNWFDTIERLTAVESFDFLSTDIFMKLTCNKSNISRSVYNNESNIQIKDSFEIVPSDLQNAKDLSLFYTQLKLLLSDLKSKIKYSENLKFNRGLKAFYLLIISKMREMNLPYHYIYTQILEFGIENKNTSANGPIVLTEYACYLTEILHNMIEVILLLIETDKIIFEKFSISLNSLSELINFSDGSKKGIIEDLINLSIFLKEKGEDFRVLVLKIAQVYLQEEGYFEQAKNSQIFDKIGTFSIDTIASKRVTSEFYGNYSTLLSIEILTDMVEIHSYSLDDKLRSSNLTEGISETGLERINSFNSFGWLIRYIHHRDSRIRFMTWNLLRSLVSKNLVKQHPTLIDESIQ